MFLLQHVLEEPTAVELQQVALLSVTTSLHLDFVIPQEVDDGQQSVLLLLHFDDGQLLPTFADVETEVVEHDVLQQFPPVLQGFLVFLELQRIDFVVVVISIPPLSKSTSLHVVFVIAFWQEPELQHDDVGVPPLHLPIF